MFIDQVTVEIKSGDGGNGAITFRREKYVPKGGPSGGNGGVGGSVYFVGDSQLSTLLDFKYKRTYFAEDGDDGASSLKDGKSGEDIIIRVPAGTLVKDAETKEVLFDVDEDRKMILALEGGRGGKGNANFATSTNQTPRYAEPGKPGKYLKVVLELKLIADIGLVGFPNAGKSTLISTISQAKPKIADYPFTTLEPNLGIVRYKDYKSLTVADIPGIIEGAHKGKGLGLKFLRHIERTKALFFLLDISSPTLKQDYKTLLRELRRYSPEMLNKPRLVGLSKCDLLPPEKVEQYLEKAKLIWKSETIAFSSAAHINIDLLKDKFWEYSRKENS